MLLISWMCENSPPGCSGSGIGRGGEAGGGGGGGGGGVDRFTPGFPAPISPLFLLTRYRCRYCVAGSNDELSVTLHMMQSHNDSISRPIDSLGATAAAGNLVGNFGIPGFGDSCLSAQFGPFTGGGGPSIAHRPSNSIGLFDGALSGPSAVYDGLMSGSGGHGGHRGLMLPTALAGPMAHHSATFRPPMLPTPTSLSHSMLTDGVAGPSSSIPMPPILEPLTASSSDQIRCETCGKQLNRNKPLSSLLNHAKRHFTTKQFVCTECNYGSSEAAHVRNHMRMRHQLHNQEPLDVKNTFLQDAWIKIASRCFPSMAEQLSRFRFKRFRRRGAQNAT